MSEDRLKREQRRRNKKSHIAESLRHPINRQRVKPGKKKYEDDAERRYRRYRDVREVGLSESGELAEKLNEKFNREL